MLRIIPTEHFTSVTIRGDFQDFDELIDSIYRLAEIDEEAEDLKYLAKEYKTSIYELEDPGLVYPEEIEW